MPTDQELLAQLTSMSSELDRRARGAQRLDDYHDGNHPIPDVVIRSKATKAYRLILDLADTNWPQLIVDSVDERLEVQGISLGDEELDKRAWDFWQTNGLDADSSLTHQSALTTARAFVIVWPSAGGGAPDITPEHASTCIVQYAPGSRRVRVAALRRWEDAGRWYATLYRPDGVYKFQSKRLPGTTNSYSRTDWERREVPGEVWPLPNPFGPLVPVVEVAVNRDLRPSPYGRAFGEFERNVGHIDRINFATFSQIVAMTWSGFPLRALIGDPILRDDDGNPLAPFDVAADSLVQIENPDGKLMQLPEANLENYGKTIDRYVQQLAAITKTPPHYLLGQLVNLSADAIRAAEAGLVSKVRRHQNRIGEAWEEVFRLSLIAAGQDVPASAQGAQIIWKDPESRSMAERADAAVKLKDILPWQALASKVLAATPQEIQAWSEQRGADALSALIAQPAPAAAVPPVA